MFGLKEDGRKALKKKEGREKKNHYFFFWLERNWGIKKNNGGNTFPLDPPFFSLSKLGRNEKVERIFLWGLPISFSFFFLKKHYFSSILLYKPNTMKENYFLFPFFSFLIFFFLPFFLPNIVITLENNCSYSRAYHKHM